ncbi:SIS domain-containing protein [Streptomyces sp. T1317-0309]|nr:SIS domain-containing protein [Streptomyces sp. T1317-0309]
MSEQPSGGEPQGGNELAGRFFDAAIGMLRRVRDEEAEEIAAAGTLVADVVAAGGRLFAFGAGHSSLPPRTWSTGRRPRPDEPARGAGVVGVDVMPATLGSALERVDGLAGAVLDCSPLRSGDLL